MDRRTFLSLIAVGTPSLLFRGIPDRVLVTLHLHGGNDGFNTVVPYTDSAYHFYRPNIAVARHYVLPLDERFGLHPDMTDLARLYEQGDVAIVQGAGFAFPQSRSHLRSSMVWQSAWTDVLQERTGWLARTVHQRSSGSVSAVAIGTERVPLALVGTAEGATTVARAVNEEGSPTNSLSAKLSTIAGMMRWGASAHVYCVEQRGYDTHVVQQRDHAAQLKEFSQAVGSFFAKLDDSGMADRVILVAFSEFGRTARENKSFGTDHGTLGPMFVVGRQINGGLYGNPSAFDELANELPVKEVDFRQVYASVLDDWLKVPSQHVLANHYGSLPLIA